MPPNSPTQSARDAGLVSDHSHDATGYARRALVASVAGYALDGFDLLLLGFMLPAIGAELHLSGAQSGALVTWTLIGAVIGGLLFGTLSDAYGRVRMLSLSILVFALFTGLCAFSTGYHDLLAYRTVAGIGLGGEFGIGMTLVAESWPATHRARASSYVGLGWQLGVLAAALLTPLLLPLVGWRGMFLIGVTPALASFWMRRSLAEPSMFVEHARAKLLARSSVQASAAVRESFSSAASAPAPAPRSASASASAGQPSSASTSNHAKSTVPIAELFSSASAARMSIGIIVLCAVQNFGYYGLMIWMPSYLSHTFGYSLTKSGLWTAVTVLGMAAGIGLFGVLADRVGRKPAFIAYQIGAVVMVFVYASLTSPTALLIGGAVMGLFVNGMLGGYGALISECYPTRARATAQNVLFNIGRAIGGLGPLVVGALASAYGFSSAIALLAVIYVVDVIATVWLIPERRGAVLE
ncbi:putative metabolite transport protein HI_1104 [Pararobbsia alpina]|uniref:MFS transporter n=1 Tax=Pararobbsia alpina TaxID=621374 RepID=UPI0039A620A2